MPSRTSVARTMSDMEPLLSPALDFMSALAVRSETRCMRSSMRLCSDRYDSMSMALPYSRMASETFPASSYISPRRAWQSDLRLSSQSPILLPRTSSALCMNGSAC